MWPNAGASAGQAVVIVNLVSSERWLLAVGPLSWETRDAGPPPRVVCRVARELDGDWPSGWQCRSFGVASRMRSAVVALSVMASRRRR